VVDAAAAVISKADDRLGAGITLVRERSRELERLGEVALLERGVGNGNRIGARAGDPHRRGGLDEGLLDRVAVDAERKADRERYDGNADGEAHAPAPPLLCHALALVERRLQRVDAPLELDLARMVSGSCKQRHSGSGPR
jgi:hypothetical protein